MGRDLLGSRTCGLQIGGEFHGNGGLTHTGQVGLPLGANTFRRLVATQPIGGSLGAIEVTVCQGEHEVIHPVRMNVHMINELLIHDDHWLSRFLNGCRGW